MFCQKCGSGLQVDTKYCGKCGVPVPEKSDEIKSSTDEIFLANSISKDNELTHSSTDISWGMLALNILGMLVIAFMTYPIPSELRGSGASIYLLIRIGLPAICAALITAVFYAFRKKKEGPLIRRSFVMATWVILGLVILGER